MRLSVDYRFQREHEPLTPGCLEPHFGRLSWEEIYSGWSRDDLKYYWRDKQYEVVPWDSTLHPLSAEHRKEAVRQWMLWQRELRDRRSDAPDPETPELRSK
jgi:hypothetical protein